MVEKILLFFTGSLKGFLQQYISKVKGFLTKLKNISRWLKEVFYTFLQNLLHYTLGKPASLEDYIKIGSIYLSKQLLLKFVLIVCILTFFITSYAHPFLKGKLWTEEMVVNTNEFYEFTGKAKVLQKDGSLLYLGKLQQGSAEGVGEVYEEGYLVYKGEFSQNQYNGIGTLYQNGKKIYEGSFLNNKYHGEGILYDKNGNKRFSGVFEDGKQKEGVAYFENGTMQYQGTYENGLYSGQGTLYASGSNNVIRYQGSFLQNVFEGAGRLYQKGKLIYDGMFSNGLYHGEGTLYDNKTGKILYTGAFLYGAYHGEGKLYDKQTERLLYAGEFLEGKKNGIGVLYHNNGTKIYTGPFFEDEIDYKQFLNSNLNDIREAFGRETELIMLENNIFTVYEDLDVAFVFQFSEDGASPVLERIKFFGTQKIDDIKNGMTFFSAKKNMQQEAYTEYTFEVLEEDAVSFGYTDRKLQQGSMGYTIKYIQDGYFIQLYGEEEGGVVCYFEIGGKV